MGHATVGLLPGRASCYRSLISTSSSRCRIISRIWRWSTRRSSTTCCSTPLPRPCSRSRPTPNISAHRSVSWLCCTVAQLGSELVVPSSSPLSDSGRRSFPRPHPLDPSPLSLLPAGGRTPSGLSRQVRRRSPTTIPTTPTDLSRLSSTSTKRESLPRFLASLVPSELDRLCQTSVRRSPSCPRLSRRYTHRVAISNHRLVDFTNHQVTFRWRDYAHGNRKRMMTVEAPEFLRRFLLHVLPRGFVRIRSFGFLANRHRATLLSLCQRLLLDHPRPATTPANNTPRPPACFRCPQRATPMLRLESLSAWDAAQLLHQRIRLDSS